MYAELYYMHLQDGGQCNCKTNVMGRKCDTCKHLYFNLTAGNSDGCARCACDGDGSSSCDTTIGTCTCKPNVVTVSSIIHFFTTITDDLIIPPQKRWRRYIGMWLLMFRWVSNWKPVWSINTLCWVHVGFGGQGQHLNALFEKPFEPNSDYSFSQITSRLHI